MGLVEGIAEGDLIAAAKTKTLELASRPASADGSGRLAREGERAEFEKAAARAAKEHAGKPNIAALIEAVRAAFDKPLPEGLAFERQLFLKLRDDERSTAFRYAFFAERKAGKLRDMPPETEARSITRAAIIGAGTMGTGIAICFLNAGIPVTLIEDNRNTPSRKVSIASRRCLTMGCGAGNRPRCARQTDRAFELEFEP